MKWAAGLFVLTVLAGGGASEAQATQMTYDFTASSSALGGFSYAGEFLLDTTSTPTSISPAGLGGIGFWLTSSLSVSCTGTGCDPASAAVSVGVWRQLTGSNDGFYLEIDFGDFDEVDLTQFGTATSYTSLELPDTSGWTGAYIYGEFGNRVPLTLSFQQVDEPVSAALLAPGVLTLALLRRRLGFRSG